MHGFRKGHAGRDHYHVETQSKKKRTGSRAVLRTDIDSGEIQQSFKITQLGGLYFVLRILWANNQLLLPSLKLYEHAYYWHSITRILRHSTSALERAGARDTSIADIPISTLTTSVFTTNNASTCEVMQPVWRVRLRTKRQRGPRRRE